MYPMLITMLTLNDKTVENAQEIFEQCDDLPCNYWGFKDIGLPRDKIKQLVEAMKNKGKTTLLEVVSLTEKECMEGAELAVECHFDYLMGTVFYDSVFNFLKDKDIRYMPFCGKVTGHPSVLEGTVQEAIDEAKKLEKLGVDGFDLLVYRYTGDPEQYAREFINNIKLPVVIAGSIYNLERINKVKELNAWAFTIGSAFFQKKFVKGGSFREQLKAVLSFITRWQ